MFLDIKTIFVIHILSSWLMVLALWAAYAGKFRDGVGKWTMALFVFSIGDILILGRGAVSDYLSIIMANTLLAVGNSLAYAAVCDFIPRRSNPWVLFSPPLVTPVTFWLLIGNPAARVMAIGLILGLQNLVVISMILGDPKFWEYRMRWLLFAGYFSAILMYLGRAVAAVLMPGFFQTMFAANMIQSLTLSFGFFSLILISFGFILLSRERTDFQNQQTSEDLRQSEERFRSISASAQDAIIMMDSEGTISYWNEGAEKIFGYTSNEVMGKELHPLLAPEKYYQPFRKGLDQFKETGEGNAIGKTLELSALRKDGSEFPIELSLSAAHMRNRWSAIGMIRDITERKQLEEMHQKMSITDELTGLYNRRGFFTLSQQQMKIVERARQDMLLFFADLDNMKHINDTLGHQEGDKALVEVATILKETFRESDIIGRIGGDEFAILAIDTTEETREVLINRLHKSLDANNGLEGRNYMLSLGIGIAHYDPENPSSLDELMARADTLMYEEKRKKQN